jgi:tetratricopeptide (TPR) repeat protein/tRNA A-37 threonylcarbamoyl transferase component Bud32
MSNDYTFDELERSYEEYLQIEETERVTWLETHFAKRPALKTALIEMLENQKESISFFKDLQRSLAEGWFVDNIPTLSTNERVGKYKIKSLLGKGGMSNVYLAERNDGEFEQLVAIKCFPKQVIHEQDEEIRKREQRILAELHHPNIATLIDAGVTENEVLYFIMEYIDGEPIDDYINNNDLNFTQRLKLFKQVVKTIAFAHSKLILHLDLKPSNIFIDKRGQVKLLDFGIATQLNTEQSKSGFFFGTPSIAAPEQVAGHVLSTATDIYQLGILMHTVLADESPFVPASKSTEQLTKLDPGSQIAQISISEQIQKEPASLIEKCIASNPDERYASAVELLQDLERLEKGYPVTTMPNKIWYRTKKYIGRHQVQVFALILILVSVLGGLTVSIWQANEAKIQRDIAIEKEQVASITTGFLSDLFIQAHPSKAKGDTATVYELLQKGHNQLTNFKGPSAAKLQLLNTISTSYRGIGDYVSAKKIMDEAQLLARDSSLALSPSFIRNLVELGLYQRDIGQNDSAVVLFNRAIHLYEEIDYPEQDSLYTEVLKRLGHVYKVQDKFDSATYFMNKAINLEEQIWPDKNNLRLAESYYIMASIYVDQNLIDEAINYQKRSLELCEQLMGANYPGTMVNLNLLARIYNKNGDYEKALPYNIRAKDIAVNLFGKAHPETATNMSNLGATHERLSNYDSAYIYYASALDIRDKVYADHSNNWHASSYLSLLGLFVLTEKYDSADFYLNQALKICSSQSVSKARHAKAYDWGGELYKRKGNVLKAKDYFQNSFDLYSSYLPKDNYLVIKTEAKIQQMDSILANSSPL